MKDQLTITNSNLALIVITWPNIMLKRDASFRGGFGGLLFFLASAASPIFRGRRAP